MLESLLLVRHDPFVKKLVVPDSLNRNSARAALEGAERTGLRLLRLVTTKLGFRDLANVDVLDIGCGVRFTQTIINEGVSIKSYTGIDVCLPVIEFLKTNVHDPRFSFAHWDVHNAMYNPEFPHKMRGDSVLPVRGDYDVIWLFSVFTHLNPEDSDALFAVLRRHVRPSGTLFFSAFIRDNVAQFEDKDPASPLLRAAYGEGYMRELATRNGWDVISVDAPDFERIIQHQFLCRPSGASGIVG